MRRCAPAATGSADCSRRAAPGRIRSRVQSALELGIADRRRDRVGVRVAVAGDVNPRHRTRLSPHRGGYGEAYDGLQRARDGLHGCQRLGGGDGRSGTVCRARVRSPPPITPLGIAKALSEVRSELRARPRLPPGDTRFSLRRTHELQRDTLRVLLGHYERFGPIFTFRSLHRPVVALIGPAAKPLRDSLWSRALQLAPGHVRRAALAADRRRPDHHRLGLPRSRAADHDARLSSPADGGRGGGDERRGGAGAGGLERRDHGRRLRVDPGARDEHRDARSGRARPP